MEVLPEEDSVKSAAVAIARKILDNDKSVHCIFNMMEQLTAFGDHIVAKIEKDDPAFRVSCSSGCSFCCHMQVKVTPPEALDIFNFVLSRLDTPALERLHKRIHNNINLTNGKVLEERVFLKQKTPCIFLTDHTCDIYQVRPLICHAWHSLNRTSCEMAYETGNPKSEIETAPLRNYVFSMIRDAIKDISYSMHWEYGTYELPFAINRCFRLAEPKETWFVGKSLFNRP